MTASAESSRSSVGRPNMPAGYGIEPAETGLLPWSWVAERLARSRNYWIATTRPNGRPHVAPVWGIWLDETLLFGTDAQSLKARNLAASPAVAVHLESSDEVVILEGIARQLANSQIIARYVDAYESKYRFRPEPTAAGQLTFQLVYHTVLAWKESEFPTTATRWRFARE